MRLGDQSGSGILKGTINLLLKPDESLSFYTLNYKEKSATMYAERPTKYKVKQIIKLILRIKILK